MGTRAGTAYVELQPDLGSFNKQIDAALGPLSGKFGKFGKAAAVGLGAVAVGGAAAGKALYDIGAQFDDAYDKIRVGTGATGKQLEGLKGDFKEVVKSVPTDFGSASTAIADLNTRLGVTGKPLQDLSKQFLELSRITETDVGDNVKDVTRLFGDWSVKTKQQSGTLDGLFRVSQATGIEVGKLSRDLVQFGSPLRQLGFKLEESAAMFAKFEKEGVNAQTLLPGFKQAVSNMARPTSTLKDKFDGLGITLGGSFKQTLGQVFEALGSMKNEQEAAALAADVFGTRAGPDMAAAIQEGRFELDELMKTFRNGKDTILGAGEDTQDFSEKWQLFKNRVLVALEPLAMKVFDAMGSMMDGVTAAGEWLSTDGKRHWATFREAVLDVWEVIDGPLSEVFGVVLGIAKRAFAGIKQAFSGFVQTFRGIVDVFGGIIQGDFGRIWDGIKGIFSGALDVLIGALRNSTAAMREIGGRMVTAIWEGIKSLPKVLAKAGKWVVEQIIDGFKSLPKLLLKAAEWYYKMTWKGIKAQVGLFLDIGEWVIDKLVDGFKSLPGLIRGAAVWFKDRIVSAIKALPGAFLSAGEWVIRKVVQGLRTVVGGLADFGTWILDKVTDGVRSAASGFKDAGRFIIDKLADGFKAGVNTVIGFVNSIISAINRIPGVSVDSVQKLARGGVAGASLPHGRIGSPTVVVGEEAPTHPEYVIPTNPAYRDRAQMLLGEVASRVGFDRDRLAFYAQGGIHGDRKGGIPGPGSIISKLPGVGELPGWATGLGKFLISTVTKWIKDKVGDALGLGRGNLNDLTALAAKFGLAMSSGYRPGDDGYHGVNRARDYAGSAGRMLAFAKFVAQKLGGRLLELIHTPLGYGIKNGSRVGLGFWGPAVNADHYDHVHAAMHKGGYIVPPGGEREMTILGERGEYVADAAEQSRIAAALAQRGTLIGDIYIGGEKIDERVEIKHREMKRGEEQRYAAGVRRR